MTCPCCGEPTQVWMPGVLWNFVCKNPECPESTFYQGEYPKAVCPRKRFDAFSEESTSREHTGNECPECYSTDTLYRTWNLGGNWVITCWMCWSCDHRWGWPND